MASHPGIPNWRKYMNAMARLAVVLVALLCGMRLVLTERGREKNSSSTQRELSGNKGRISSEVCRLLFTALYNSTQTHSCCAHAMIHSCRMGGGANGDGGSIVSLIDN